MMQSYVHLAYLTPQTEDVQMVEEEADNDDNYTTEEEFIKGYQHFKLSQSGHLHIMT